MLLATNVYPSIKAERAYTACRPEQAAIGALACSADDHFLPEFFGDEVGALVA